MTEIDYSFRPATYWPAGGAPEEGVAVAHITLDSVLGDVMSVIAVPAPGGRIRFCVLNDEGGEPVGPLAETADGPLSLRELIDLIDGVKLGEGLELGLVYGTLHMNDLVGTGRPEDTSFISVGSEIYDDLWAHYDAQIRTWVMGVRET